MGEDSKIEEDAIWELINHLEEKMEELDDLNEIKPLTDEQRKEYEELNQTINDLLDRIDDGDKD